MCGSPGVSCYAPQTPGTYRCCTLDVDYTELQYCNLQDEFEAHVSCGVTHCKTGSARCYYAWEIGAGCDWAGYECASTHWRADCSDDAIPFNEVIGNVYCPNGCFGSSCVADPCDVNAYCSGTGDVCCDQDHYATCTRNLIAGSETFCELGCAAGACISHPCVPGATCSGEGPFCCDSDTVATCSGGEVSGSVQNCGSPGCSGGACNPSPWCMSGAVCPQEGAWCCDEITEVQCSGTPVATHNGAPVCASGACRNDTCVPECANGAACSTTGDYCCTENILATCDAGGSLIPLTVSVIR